MLHSYNGSLSSSLSVRVVAYVLIAGDGVGISGRPAGEPKSQNLGEGSGQRERPLHELGLRPRCHLGDHARKSVVIRDRFGIFEAK